MKKAFTLAEVLITITIIGVVAAISIPSVIVNHQQKEYKTGLKKALTNLNQAIALNIAMEDQTPAENPDTFSYFARHMNVIKTVPDTRTGDFATGSWANAALYTADGMRFEFRAGGTPRGGHCGGKRKKDDGTIVEVPPTEDALFGDGQCVKGISTSPVNRIYESQYVLKGRDDLQVTGNRYVHACHARQTGIMRDNAVAEDDDMDMAFHYESCGGCGSFGLYNNPTNKMLPPCLIVVDVNGDRKPNPPSANCKFDEDRYRAYRRLFFSNPTTEEGKKDRANQLKGYNDDCFMKQNVFVQPDSNGKVGRVNDVFTVMITDKEALPYGTVAQKSMYGN